MSLTSVWNLINESMKSISGELANAQLFIMRLCEALDLPPPDFSCARESDNHYVFEKSVSFGSLNGRQRTGRIDLYKHGCFILESKQSALGKIARAGAHAGSHPRPHGPDSAGRRPGAMRWRRAMIKARLQAEHYARALPEAPPFLIILDVGRVMEVYADFTGGALGYAPFPDPGHHRIYMEDLLRSEIQRRVRLIWTDPWRLAGEMLAPQDHDDPLAPYLLARATRGLARSLPWESRAQAANGERFAPCLDMRARNGSCRILV